MSWLRWSVEINRAALLRPVSRELVTEKINISMLDYMDGTRGWGVVLQYMV